ncbi:PD-(D/E)XK nuclease family protein [uncultured Mobiluncus sp.]|uniref:PD-(D/E)XK nuclease family protein n=1 Tax=uncultured Mobiluncus sp. TaxID=293425 RepID=UPI00261E0165|nr:PD-(D/E)XK nuclease family protein [uncultured Mobiluncus sp.]
MEIFDDLSRRVRHSLNDGESVLVAGVPASGKTTLLAQLLVDNPRMLVLSPDAGTARRLSERALEIRAQSEDPHCPMGASKGFVAEIFARFNQWRREGGLPEVRLATDAEVMVQIQDFLAEMPLEEELRSALETQGFRRDLVDGIFRVRAFAGGASSDPAPPAVHPLVTQLIQAMQTDREAQRLQARQSAWPLDTASLFEEYLLAVKAGAPVPELVGVDDLQNFNGLMIDILSLWATHGTALVACTLPETCVNTYRGASPHLSEKLWQQLGKIPGKTVTEILLSREHVPAPLRSLWRTAVNRLGVHGISARLWTPAGESSPDSAQTESTAAPDCPDHVILVEKPTDTAQYREIGTLLQDAHIFSDHPLPYSQMAVLTRSSREARQVAEVLENMDIPVVVPGAVGQLNEGRLTRCLLQMMQAVCVEHPDQVELSDLDLAGLLSSALVGWDVWRMRRMDSYLHDLTLLPPGEVDDGEQQSPSAMESGSVADDEQSESDTVGILPYIRQFLRTVISGQDFSGRTLAEITSEFPDANQLANLAGALRSGWQQWKTDSGSVQLLLWKLWDGLGRAELLQARALQPGLVPMVRSTLQLDLDLVMDLFKTADWFEARNPGQTAADFAQGMLARDLPTGTVAPHHLVHDAVTVMPAAAAVSQHWPLVAVAGLTDGSWPAMRWPGSILGASMFELENHDDPANSSSAGYLWNWQNEYRHFFTALTRCTQRLILGTTAQDGVGRSTFLTPLVQTLQLEPKQHRPLPTNLRDFVAYLRAACLGGETSWGTPTIDAPTAAGLLAKLAVGDCPAAHPDNWLGALPVSGTNLESTEVHIYASGLERALENPLDYVLSWSGYSNDDDDPYAPNKVGNIVHEAAEILGRRYWWKDHGPRDDLEYDQVLTELRNEVRNLLGPLSEDTWVEWNFRRRIETCLVPLATFLVNHQYPSLFEVRYPARLPASSGKGALVYNARIDRVMFFEGRTILIDYKTGSLTNFSASSVAGNLQLALYQAAYNASALGLQQPCDLAEIVGLLVPPDSDAPLNSQGIEEPRDPKIWVQKALASGTETITLPNPFSAEQRQILLDPLAWLHGEAPGAPDPETMLLKDYLQDRVDLAVAAFSGPNLAQIESLGAWGAGNNLGVEVRQR